MPSDLWGMEAFSNTRI